MQFSGSGYADTNAYIYIYRAIPATLDGIQQYVSSIGKDQAFFWYTGLMKKFFGNDNYHPFLFFIALVQTLALIKLYRNYSLDFGLSFFLFIASADYFAWMFNGIRQFLALAIVYLAIPLLVERKYIKFFAVVMMASLFHGTAIIMIPIAIITNGKPWNKKTLLLIAVGLFAIVFTSSFTEVMEESLEGTAYSANIQEMRTQQGTNVFRVLFYCLPTLVAFVGRKKLLLANSQVLNISINMSIVSAVI